MNIAAEIFKGQATVFSTSFRKSCGVSREIFHPGEPTSRAFLQFIGHVTEGSIIIRLTFLQCLLTSLPHPLRFFIAIVPQPFHQGFRTRFPEVLLDKLNCIGIPTIDVFGSL